MTTKWYEELQRYNITINAWELGVIGAAIVTTDSVEKIPNLWKQLMELRKSIEAADGVTKEFLPNGYVKMTNRDGLIIMRPRQQWLDDDP